VPLAAGNEAAILGKVNGLDDYALSHPRGDTPTAAALATARDSAGLTDGDRENVVVLVTDGIPTCGGGVGQVIDQLYARTPSVRTFVIGIGSECQSNASTLDNWADRGHTARSGPTHYYQANDAADLGAALLDAIGGATCVFQLASPPSDPTTLAITLDGMAISADPVDGYTYDATQDAVTLHGASCTQLAASTTKQLDAVINCPLVQ
jgi:hypothetical protein